MYFDEANILVRSGDGVNGAIHFRREKYVPRGGPDGGDGGRGGDVVLEVGPAVDTLLSFQHKREFLAENGKNGAGKNMRGKSAEALVIEVPAGTVVRDNATGEVLGDLTAPGQRLVVARGGRGGRGNARFANASRQVPKVAEKGAPGQERQLRLELKLIADIGNVGVPNAGKSTLLAAFIRASQEERIALGLSRTIQKMAAMDDDDLLKQVRELAAQVSGDIIEMDDVTEEEDEDTR